MTARQIKLPFSVKVVNVQDRLGGVIDWNVKINEGELMFGFLMPVSWFSFAEAERMFIIRGWTRLPFS